MDGGVEVTFIHVKMDVGGAGKRGRINYISPFADFCKQKKGIIAIQNNDDNLCLARALVVAIAFSKKDDGEEERKHFKRICRVDRNFQRDEAERLCREADVDLRTGGGVEELRKFQQYFENYSITVYNDRRGRSTMFEGPIPTVDNVMRNLDLIFWQNHYNVITSLTSAFTTDKYCRSCKYPYSLQQKHRCPSKCLCCNDNFLCVEIPEEVKLCQVCNRIFKNKKCFENHLKPLFTKQMTTCNVVKCCPSCKTVFNVLLNK